MKLFNRNGSTFALMCEKLQEFARRTRKMRRVNRGCLTSTTAIECLEDRNLLSGIGNPDLPPYGQNEEGDIVIQATEFAVNTDAPDGTHSWVASVEHGADVMQVLPNINSPYGPASLSDWIYVEKSGRYFIYVKGRGDSGADNSINFAVDGQIQPNSDRISLPVAATTSWWSTTMDGTRPFVDLDVGFHEVSIVMREDGAIVETLALSLDSIADPNIDEPAISDRVYFVSDLPFSENGFHGGVGRDRFYFSETISMGNELIPKALGTHAAPGERVLTVPIPSIAERFKATVGPDDSQPGAEFSVKVLVDDVLVFESGLITNRTPPMEIAVDVFGAETLKLFVNSEGVIYSDAVVWGACTVHIQRDDASSKVCGRHAICRTQCSRWRTAGPPLLLS